MSTVAKSLLVTLYAFGGAAAAQSIQSLDTVRQAAEQFIAAQLKTAGDAVHTFATAGALDSRLRLPQCGVPLAAFLPQGASAAARTTVGVRCTLPAWSVYVPVGVETQMSVLVVRQAAGRNAVLTAADVETQQRRVPGFATNYVSDVNALAGRHLKMPAPPGTALTTELLVRDTLVKRGQRVTLLAAVGGIEVRAQGEALSDATPAGRVRVQNLSSRLVVEGQVESADLVRVTP